MIVNNISTMIGHRKTDISEVAKIANLSYNTVYNLYYDKTKGIDFETLNKLCYTLNCTVSDLIKYVPDKQ
ncbi:helix-turn-helix transcriptional regulator [bacterium]|nr:helix-turn-helix transcriptional regulator [bacterium]MBO5446128.1 helix-turn-helix transcriptional regulator [bacterium]MBR6722875.1 helix-turn-helix transcriptional regulator [bacterium]